MNILILDSWLRENIKTDATPKDIAKHLSLTSVSVEKVEKLTNDYLYDIEVTTNRPDLMSVLGIARELNASLSQNGIKTEFIEKNYKPLKTGENSLLEIKTDKKLVNRVTAAVMEVSVSKSPTFMTERLEKSNIRSLNNLIDVTNYIMREIGHPAHVFDYDRLGKKLTIRESFQGETITTLDGKTHVLKGGDIVAEDGNGRIIDLLGIMGLENSVVTDQTKKIVLFFDNNNPKKIRKTSMGLGIRTEAAVLNEKNVDPELITSTMQRGIELYEKYSDGKLLGNVIDIYTNKPEIKSVKVRKERISKIIGVKIDDKTIVEILKNLTFKVENNTNYLTVTPPSFRASDIQIEEDVIEEIARIYGYHKIPNALPPLSNKKTTNMEDNFFYWENRVKDAMKFWGFNEVYTYSMVSEEFYEGPADSAVKIANPLSEEHVYMRVTLIPSLLEVVRNNFQESLAVFEIANIYLKRNNDLPDERPHFAAILKKQSRNLFFELKGTMEAIFDDLGIENYSFKKRSEGGAGADVFIENKQVGNVELLEEDVVNFELDFKMLVKNATNKKIYKLIPEYPPIIEDLRIESKKDTEYKKIVDIILNASPLIVSTELIDEYENKMTFRISYQDKTKNLSNEDVAPIREKLEKTIKEKLHAKIG